MLESLKGSALWAAVAIVLGVLGAATYLASQAILSGSDMLAIITPILTGVVGVTAAHVGGNTAITAGVSTVPAPAPTLAPEAPAPPVPASGAISVSNSPTEPTERVI